METPLDVQQILAALAFSSAAFLTGLWLLHGTTPDGRPRGRGPTTPPVSAAASPASGRRFAA